MKVYNKVVIDMATLEVLEEDSFEYSGPVALCGGGGGSSGEIIYPEHMTSCHKEWLNGVVSDGYHHLDVSGGQSVTQAMNAAMQVGSPYVQTGYVPYNPDTRITNMELALDDYDNMLAGIITTPAETLISNLVNAFTAKQTTQLTTEIYPRFEAGMLNINAVQSSAFVLGRANIEAKKLEAIADYTASISPNIIGIAYQDVFNYREHMKSLAHMGIELERLAIIAKSEYQTKLADSLAMDRMWDLEVFKYGCNVMASIGSASVHTGQKSVSPGQSALGGAMSGAAMGAMWGATSTGPGAPIGAAIGGLLGGLAGYLSA